MLEWTSTGGGLIAVAILGGLGWLIKESLKKNWREREQLQTDRMKMCLAVLEPVIRAFSGAKNERDMKKALRHIASHEHRRNVFFLSLMGSPASVRAYNDSLKLKMLAATAVMIVVVTARNVVECHRSKIVMSENPVNGGRRHVRSTRHRASAATAVSSCIGAMP